jgi:hypothetical protein
MLSIVGLLADYSEWAIVEVDGQGPSQRLSYSGLDSEFGLLNVPMYGAVLLAFLFTSGRVLRPVWPSVTTMLVGITVSSLAGLYVALNSHGPGPAGPGKDFTPWAMAHCWPTEAARASITLGIGPYLTLGIGLGLAILGGSQSRRFHRRHEHLTG